MKIVLNEGLNPLSPTRSYLAASLTRVFQEERKISYMGCPHAFTHPQSAVSPPMVTATYANTPDSGSPLHATYVRPSLDTWLKSIIFNSRFRMNSAHLLLFSFTYSAKHRPAMRFYMLKHIGNGSKGGDGFGNKVFLYIFLQC